MDISLRDVAREAGVSAATVSRVMNNRSHVSDETREKVEEAISRLGYSPPYRRPKTEQSLVVLAVPDVTSAFFAEVVCGVEQQLYENGFDLVLYNVGTRPLSDIVGRLQSNTVRGLVMVTPRIGEDEQLDDFHLELPMVVVDYHNEGSRAPHVSVDNLRAGYSATQYLINKGHTRIGIVTGPLEVQSAMERLRGYRLALDEAGLPFDEQLVREGDFREIGGFSETRQLLSISNPRPTAVFCCNDLMAVGALRALGELRIPVPGGMDVVGFDDLPIAKLVTPSLTTVQQPIRDMAETATRMLLRLIAGERLETNRIILETRLVIRDTA